MDCSPPGSSVHGIFQARTLEWVAIPFSRGPSQPRDSGVCSNLWRPLAHSHISPILLLHMVVSLCLLLMRKSVTFDEEFFPGGSEGKASACDAEDPGSIPGNPIQYSCWRIPWTEEPGGLQSTGTWLSDYTSPYCINTSS